MTSCHPLVGIIILNWNNPDDTLACLRSVMALNYPTDRRQVIVVDNGSTDDSVARIRSAYPDVLLIETGANLGYAGGNNFGIRKALQQGAEWILILNEDTILDSSCAYELVLATSQDSSVGIVGPIVYHADTISEIQAAGGNLDNNFDVRWRGMGESDRGQFDAAVEVDIVHGCAIMLNRKLLETVGGFDERFFLYREEVDLCIRAKRAGYKVLFCPQARVWHRRPTRSSSRRALTTYYMTRNTYLLLANAHADLTAYIRTAMRHLIWLANWSINPKWHHKREERNALLRGLIDALMGKYGKQDWHYGT